MFYQCFKKKNLCNNTWSLLFGCFSRMKKLSMFGVLCCEIPTWNKVHNKCHHISKTNTLGWDVLRKPHFKKKCPSETIKALQLCLWAGRPVLEKLSIQQNVTYPYFLPIFTSSARHGVHTWGSFWLARGARGIMPWLIRLGCLTLLAARCRQDSKHSTWESMNLTLLSDGCILKLQKYQY